MTSPSFALPAQPATLRFDAWWEIAAGAFEETDVMSVEYSVDGGATWRLAQRLNPAGPPFGSLHQPYTSGGLRQPGEWRRHVVDLAAAAGNANVRVRFRFDSVDTLGQGFRGLLIDAVQVDGSVMPESSPGGDATPVATTPGDVPGAASVPGRTLVLEPIRGRSAFRTPRQARATRLAGPTVVPFGTVVDSRRGVVRITTARDGSGGTQTGTFHGGVFQIRQPAPPVVVLALRGGRFPHCGRGCTSSTHRRRRSSRIRRLWGSSTGHFTTSGRYASATVRGTRWLVEDRLAETVVNVRTGVALARDFIRDRDVIVEAGETYTARAVFTNKQRGNPRFGRRYTLAVRNGIVVHVYATERIQLGPA